ncbi:amino acid transporter [Hyphomicrobium sp. D-2]|uniref:nucleotidyltransferase domain-containing protein n=1 Tax=Hyphomicrobium sp. D-2 TaxID=3041621 RepID=UPI002454A6FA|nr:amino acid transporter [Hyphomicrobium sp. D-2]MDH4982497.1 amino acid transporter [Hyphomicrobium sp. D-2]
MQPPSDDAWSAWDPEQLAQRLRGVPCVWYVVGGWALDLWHGEQTRPHDDLEFAVLPDDIARFRAALSELEFFTAHDGQLEHLAADAVPAPHIGQMWGLDREAGCWRVDMMIERGTQMRWVCKRDEAIHAPRAEMVSRSAGGIPYLAPEAVLLFKAKYRREKDETDFARALPKLDAGQRERLADWLAIIHPGHGWLESL